MQRTKILIVVAGAAVLLCLNFFEKEVRNFVYLMSSPVQKVLWKAGDNVSDFLASLFKVKNLEMENEQIKLYNFRLIAENASLRALKKENETLRGALEIGLEKEFKLIFSQIIGKEPSRDFILLDRGGEDGVREGLAVITGEKVLCGRISEVYKNFSKAELSSNKEMSFDVAVGKSTAGAVAKGEGGLKILIELIPQDVQIQENENVFTSALGAVFPGNLLVGKVKKTLKSDIEPFQKAEVKPSCDIKELNRLFIVAGR